MMLMSGPNKFWIKLGLCVSEQNRLNGRILSDIYSGWIQPMNMFLLTLHKYAIVMSLQASFIYLFWKDHVA